MNILETIFSDPATAAMAGMLLFATMFVILSWWVLSSKHEDTNKAKR